MRREVIPVRRSEVVVEGAGRSAGGGGEVAGGGGRGPVVRRWWEGGGVLGDGSGVRVLAVGRLALHLEVVGQRREVVPVRPVVLTEGQAWVDVTARHL